MMGSRVRVARLFPLLALAWAGLACTSAQPPAATATIGAPGASPAVASSPPAGSPAGNPSPITAARPVASPAPATRPATSGGEFAIAIDPDRRWSIWHPTTLRRERLSDDLIVFISPDRGTFVAVDSFEATPGIAGNTGEGLRNRARDALDRIYGRPVQAVPSDQPPIGFSSFSTGVTFQTDRGSRGEALYTDPSRTGENRIYGVLYGYRGETEATRKPALEAAAASFMAVAVQPIQPPGNAPDVWVVSSQGFRSFSQVFPVEHFVAVFRRTGPAWQEIARQSLPCPDFLGAGSVTRVPLEPSRVWLQVEGGAGAHAGCFDLLTYDQPGLQLAVDHGHSSPGAGFLRELDGDGQLEVVLDETDSYVFCYACGVRRIAYRVLRWDGSALTEVRLTPLPETAPAAARTANNRAVELARASLWQDARATIDRASGAAPNDATVRWNAALIRVTADAAERLLGEGGYPILQAVFFGDYAAAVDPFRSLAPSDIFNPNSPLIVGTPAEHSREQLTEAITSTTSLALGAEPNLDGAHFLRGWAEYLAAPGSRAAIDAVARAAQLAPGDRLFADSLDFLRWGGPPSSSSGPTRPANPERIRFAAGGTSATVTATPRPGTPAGYILGVQAGQRLIVTATGGLAIAVFGADGQTIPATTSGAGRWEGSLPTSGDVTVAIAGQGTSTVTIEIPPPGR